MEGSIEVKVSVTLRVLAGHLPDFRRARRGGLFAVFIFNGLGEFFLEDFMAQAWLRLCWRDWGNFAGVAGALGMVFFCRSTYSKGKGEHGKISATEAAGLFESAWVETAHGALEFGDAGGVIQSPATNRPRSRSAREKPAGSLTELGWPPPNQEVHPSHFVPGNMGRQNARRFLLVKNTAQHKKRISATGFLVKAWLIVTPAVLRRGRA